LLSKCDVTRLALELCALFIWSLQDYDAFFVANENVEVQEFLKLDPEINNGQVSYVVLLFTYMTVS